MGESGRERGVVGRESEGDGVPHSESMSSRADLNRERAGCVPAGEAGGMPSILTGVGRSVV